MGEQHSERFPGSGLGSHVNTDDDSKAPPRTSEGQLSARSWPDLYTD